MDALHKHMLEVGIVLFLDDHNRWGKDRRRSDGVVVVLNMGLHDNHHEVEDNHREDRAFHEVASDIDLYHHSTLHGEERATDDGTRHVGGCNHEEEAHDDYRNNRLEDLHTHLLDEVEIEIGNGHVEPHLEAVLRVSLMAFVDDFGFERTSAMQWTFAPLNSVPSSFSTAVFRSAAVSNSTNLAKLLTIVMWLDMLDE